MSGLYTQSRVPPPRTVSWSPAYSSGNRDTVGSGPRVGRTGVYDELVIPTATSTPTEPSEFARRVRAAQE